MAFKLERDEMGRMQCPFVWWAPMEAGTVAYMDEVFTETWCRQPERLWHKNFIKGEQNHENYQKNFLNGSCTDDGAVAERNCVRRHHHGHRNNLSLQSGNQDQRPYR